MDELGIDVASVLTNLIPGFIFIWIFYALTTHRKPGQFDQIIHALIATTLLHMIVLALGSFFLWIGKWHVLGSWTMRSELIVSLITASAAGFLMAQLARYDALFRILRWMGLTTRSHNASEWCRVFERSGLYVVLHLRGDRRIYGWPFHCPSDHKHGHFYLVQAEWLGEGIHEPLLSQAEGILIKAEDVEMVEYIQGKQI